MIIKGLKKSFLKHYFSGLKLKNMFVVGKQKKLKMISVKGFVVVAEQLFAWNIFYSSP